MAGTFEPRDGASPWRPYASRVSFRLNGAGLVPARSPVDQVAAPDREAEPDGYLVLVGEADRIHFLDWGGPGRDPAAGGAGTGPGVLLVHGLLSTAWTWAPIARRLRRDRRVVAVDLRGHGLSDAPTEGYDRATLTDDLVAVAEGSGLLRMGEGAGGPDDRLVLVGHGFGAMICAWAAARLGPRCAGLVLVDGGWEDLEAATGMDADELLRGLDEPPEVLRSMATYLADREAYDPPSWDDDQEAAARAAVVELPVGRVEPAVHPHVREAAVRAMFDYRPVEVLADVVAPVTVLAAADEDGTRGRSLEATAGILAGLGRGAIRVAGWPMVGHNLMRYRPVEVAAAVLAADRQEDGS
jgi:pimeloyl-ACP methyl ester carboxylesterase